MGLGLGLGLGLGAGGAAAQIPFNTQVKTLLGSQLRALLDANSVTLTGSQVNTVIDQSGNGFTFTRSGSPQLVASAINGLPGVSFTTADRITSPVVSSTLLNGTSCERIAVFFATAGNFMTELNFGSVGSASNIPFTDNNVYDAFGVTVRQGGFAKTGTYTSGCIYGSYSAANDFKAYFNGTQIFANATNTFGANAAAGLLGVSGGVFTLCKYIVAVPNLSAGTLRRDLYRLLGSQYGIAVP